MEKADNIDMRYLIQEVENLKVELRDTKRKLKDKIKDKIQ